MKNLVTGETELFDYLAVDITSETGQLVWDLATRLEHEFEELPREYAVFLGDVAKFTSVSGYLQPTGPEALDCLKVRHINSFVCNWCGALQIAYNTFFLCMEATYHSISTDLDQ